MSTLTLGLVQMPVNEGGFAQNLERIHRTIDQHGPAHDLLLFPETSLSGFARREDVYSTAEPLDGPVVRGLIASARKSNTSVMVGLAERTPQAYYNASVLLGPQGLVASYRKTHLWIAERKLFRAGDALQVVPWKGIRVGMLICYDIEFPEPARALAHMGADLIIVANSNMQPYGPTHVRAASARAQENQVFVAMANRVGQGLRDHFAGQSIVVAPNGEPLLCMDEQEGFATVRIDLGLLASSRKPYAYLDDRRVPATGEPATLADGTRRLLLLPTGN